MEAEERVVFLVTHGEKDVGEPGNWHPDPPMSAEGREQIRTLIPKIKELVPNPSEVQTGTGRRQIEVATLLGYSAAISGFSAVWGSPATIVRISGEKHILLACGKIIAWDKYLSSRHLSNAAQEVLRGLPNKTLICSGRPLLVRLGLEPEECRGGALYALHVKHTITIELLTEGFELRDGAAGAQI